MPEPVELPSLSPALPELVLLGGAILLLMIGVFGSERTVRRIDAGAIVLLLMAGLEVAWQPSERLVTFGGSFVVDDFARFLKLLALSGSATAIVMSIRYLHRERQWRFEYSVFSSCFRLPA